MTTDNFERWFNELEGYSTRAERFWEDLEFDDPQRVKDWLHTIKVFGMLNKLTSLISCFLVQLKLPYLSNQNAHALVVQ